MNTPRRPCPIPPASRPPPDAAELAALDDLTALAAALAQRGHVTRLATSPPRLAIDSPGLGCPCCIHPGPEWFCWADPCQDAPPAPFSLRTDPLPQTIERAANLISAFTIFHQDYGPGPCPPPHPWPGPHL